MVYRVQQVHNIGAVLLTHFERSVEVLGYSNVLKFSVVSLDLHREDEIIPGDMKSEKGNKKPMNKKTKLLNNKRTKERKKKILKQELRIPCKM